MEQKIKQLIKRALTLGIFSLFPLMSLAQSTHYPQIAAIKGKVVADKTFLHLWSFAGGYKKISVEPDSVVRLDLSPEQILILDQNTEITLGPWDKKTNSYDWIALEKGRLRVKISDKSFLLKTDFLTLSPHKSDFVFEYKPERFEFRVTSLQGEMDFRAIGREDSAHITPGMSAYFVAETEYGEALFDYLLHGVKVARGKLTPPIQVEKIELQELEKRLWLERTDLRKLAALAEKKRTPEQICAKPYAEFNQCAYFCENNPKGAKKCQVALPQVQCLRKRCNANGEWKEETRVPAQFKNYCLSRDPTLMSCGDF